MKSMNWVCAAFLLMGMQGCGAKIVKADLTVRIPPVGEYAAGKNIIVGDFKDGRTSIRPEAEGGENGILLNQEWTRPHVVLVVNHAPVKTIKKAVEDLVEDAGFVLLKDQSPASESDIRMSGTLTGFGVSILNGPRGMGATVSYELTFERKGKVLATKGITGEVKGHPYGGLDQVGLKYMNKAMDRALRKTARYLSSASFQEDVLGIAAGKARKQVHSEEKDDDADARDDDSE